MKPGTIIVKDTTVHVDHDIVVKGIKKESRAICFTCPEDYINGYPGFEHKIATGSRNYVNRQVRIHRSRI